MAATFEQYEGDGNTRAFAIPFPYLDRSHIQVSLDGELQPPPTFLTASMIQLPEAPAIGVVVDVRRKTPTGIIPVNFQDGSILAEKDLDALAAYAAYLAEEGADTSATALLLGPSGNYDALGRNIENVADATLPTGLPNKGQMDAYVAAVEAIRDATEVIREATEALRNQAGASASESADSASEALAYRNQAQAATASKYDKVGGQITGHAFTAPVSVPFAASMAINAAQANVFWLAPLTGNVTSLAVSNPADGQTIQLRVPQDATGGRTLAVPAGAKIDGVQETGPSRVGLLVMTYVGTANGVPVNRWEGAWGRVPA